MVAGQLQDMEAHETEENIMMNKRYEDVKSM